MERSELIQQLSKSAEAAFAGAPVAFTYLFGSHATGRARPDSDVDVAAFLEDTVDHEGFLDVSLELMSGTKTLKVWLGEIENDPAE